MELNNRELAVLVWFIVFSGYFACKSEVRHATKNLILAFMKFKIILTCTVAAVWIYLCIYYLHKVGIWDIENIKSTIIWACTFAFVAIFNVARVTNYNMFFSKTIRDIFSATIFISFIKDFYAFNLFIEMTMIPIIAFCVSMYAGLSTKNEHKKVGNIFLSILVVIGFSYFTFSIYNIYINYSEFATKKTLIEFVFTIVLSLEFLPFVFAICVLRSYELNFIRLDLSIKDSKLRNYAKAQAMLRFNFDLNLLRRWVHDSFVVQLENTEDVKKSISNIKLRKKREINPPHVSGNLGWSPHIARGFLKQHGIDVDYYSPYDSNNWIAGSKLVQIGDGILTNNIAYYVEGDEFIAKQLKIILNIYNKAESSIAEEYFIKLCNVLIGAAFVENPDAIFALSDVEGFEKIIDGCRIKLTHENHINNLGYTLKFQIDHSVGIEPETTGTTF